MNFISLNVQGLGKVKKKRLVNMLCVQNNINFISIQESKMQFVDSFTVKA